MSRRVVIAAAILLVAIWATGATALLGMPITSTIAPSEEPEPELIDLPSGQYLWPYYSSQPGHFEQRSAINVVVYATVDEVIAILVDDAEWIETDIDEEGDAGSDAYSIIELETADPENPLGWGHAGGTERFAFMEIEGEAHWLEESEQLHDGTYYGSRYHLRLYEAPGGSEPVVAIQAHYEHFDWFTLRHSVTSIERAQQHVEADLMNRLGSDRVWREYMGNTEVYDSDGWVTLAGLSIFVLTVLVGSVQTARRQINSIRENPYLLKAFDRITGDHLLLFASMIAIILGVRFAGIGIELLEVIRIRGIAALLFPFIALGLPIAAYLLAGRIERRFDAAVSASLGLSTAVLLDYYYLGISVLPLEVILHRTGLVIAIGLIAAGGATRAMQHGRGNEFIVAGIAMWIVMLLVTLFGVI